MSAVGGIVIGTLALSALEAVVTSKAGTENVSTVVDLATKTINRLVDPSVPLIPDLRSK